MGGAKTAAAREVELRADRLKVTLFRRPLTTSRHFLFMLWRFCGWLIHYVSTHPLTLWVCIPTVALWLIARRFDGPHNGTMDEIWISVELIVWWTGLGILSSVGLGTGMHSGLLFLFPHIYFICLSSEVCNSLNFDARVNMWEGHMEPGQRFHCETQNPEGEFEKYVTFSGLFYKSAVYCFLWGVGTAIGELPPYAASYAASKAQRADEEFEVLKHEIASGKGFVARMEKWMMDFIQNRGFVGVFLLSAWPNAFFDLCGICCGHFMMPFTVFFPAVVLGKGVVKVTSQLLFFLFMFSKLCDGARVVAVGLIARLVPFVSASAIEKKVEDAINRYRLASYSISSERGGASYLEISCRIFITCTVLYFAKSCIEKFAQQRQKELDVIEIEKLKAAEDKRE